MKKLYTLLVMALFAIGANAQIARIGTMTVDINEMMLRSKAPQMTPAVRVQNVTATESNTLVKMKKSPKKGLTIDQLVGSYVTVSSVYDYDEDAKNLVEAKIPYAGYATTVTKKSANTIGIKGMAGLDNEKEIVATVDLSKGTFSIEEGQVIATSSTYGDVTIVNAQAEGALTGTIYENALVIDQIWYTTVTYQGKNYLWNGYFSSDVMKANATMDYTPLNTNLEKGPCDVYVQVDEEEHIALVCNWADWGFVIGVQLTDDNTFVVPEQLVMEGYTTTSGDETGDFYTYGKQIRGTGTATKLTFTDHWTFLSENSYWFNWYENTTITITDGTTQFVYPSIPDVEAIPADPEILGAQRYADGKDQYDDYGRIIFIIPTVDVEGNDLKTSKLSYSLYSRINGEESIIKFKKTDYKEFTTISMSEIPYSFTSENFVDEVSFKIVFIKFDFSNYDAIGVKSIYKGGGATNSTDIVWFDLNASGITPVTKVEKNDGAIYSIDGRRLNEIPAKGIYIQNGKKYLKK